MSRLVPDYMFYSYREVTPAFLSSIGIRALLIDIDNTLAPYEQPEPDEKNLDWFSDMQKAGIRMAILSNNHAPRVERFNRKIGLPFFTECGKPKKKKLLLAMRELGVTPEETAVLGDQLLTDALAGKRAGARTLIVPPIKDRTDAFFRFKRFLERPFNRAYMKKYPEFRYPDIYREDWQKAIVGKNS